MERIKNMIATAFTKKDAMDCLEAYLIFGKITEEEYKKGRKLIIKEFSK
jgi:hypothetical protein